MSLDSIEYLEEDRINGCNLYAYCGNDPVNNIDPSGHAWYHWVIGTVAATAVSVGAATLAIGTIAVGVNEGFSALSGYNAGRELMGDEAYNAVASIVTIGGAAYITGGMSLPYPSTCHSPDYTSLKDLKDQMVLNTAKSQPLLGVSSGKQLGDPRFPSWYPYAPWFDYKIKYHK